MKTLFKKLAAAIQFKPHTFLTQTILLNYAVPRIRITQQAYMDMYYIAANSGHNEIGWLGTVKKNGNTYTIEEVILFKQEVSVVETSLSPQDIAQVATDFIDAGEIDKVNELKFWGHVHPANSTAPSGQDEDQMNVLSNGNDWFIRGIFGREGRAEFTFFDWERGVRFNDVPWEMIILKDEDRENELASQVEAKVTKILYQQPSLHFSKRNFGGATNLIGPWKKQ